jgi:hypothetical protein
MRGSSRSTAAGKASPSTEVFYFGFFIGALYPAAKSRKFFPKKTKKNLKKTTFLLWGISSFILPSFF